MCLNWRSVPFRIFTLDLVHITLTRGWQQWYSLHRTYVLIVQPSGIHDDIKLFKIISSLAYQELWSLEQKEWSFPQRKSKGVSQAHFWHNAWEVKSKSESIQRILIPITLMPQSLLVQWEFPSPSLTLFTLPILWRVISPPTLHPPQSPRYLPISRFYETQAQPSRIFFSSELRSNSTRFCCTSQVGNNFISQE